MPSQVTKFECDACGSIHDTKQSAIDCESKHAEAQVHKAHYQDGDICPCKLTVRLVLAGRPKETKYALYRFESFMEKEIANERL